MKIKRLWFYLRYYIQIPCTSSILDLGYVYYSNSIANHKENQWHVFDCSWYLDNTKTQQAFWH